MGWQVTVPIADEDKMAKLDKVRKALGVLTLQEVVETAVDKLIELHESGALDKKDSAKK